jgi:hypothetical protein
MVVAFFEGELFFFDNGDDVSSVDEDEVVFEKVVVIDVVLYELFLFILGGGLEGVPFDIGRRVEEEKGWIETGAGAYQTFGSSVLFPPSV